MITLTFGNVQDPSFVSGLTKLANHAGFGPSVALSIGQTVKAIENFHVKQVERHQTLASEYGEKDEKGNLKQNSEMPGHFVVVEGKEAEFQDKVNALRHELVELQVAPVPFRLLEGVGLTPSEMHALGPVLHHDDHLKQVK